MTSARTAAPPASPPAPGSAFAGFAAGMAAAWILALATAIPWISFDAATASAEDFLAAVKSLAIGALLLPVVHTAVLWPFWRGATRRGRTRTALGLKAAAALVATIVAFAFAVDRLTPT